MLNLAATEDKIGQLFTDNLLTPPLTQPAFKLTIHPGDLDDQAINARGVSSVIVRFDRIDYESPTVSSRCTSQLNEVCFKILVNNNNLRTHRDVYHIGEAIIRLLRGRCDMLSGVTHKPVEVKSFEFTPFDKTKSCNKAEIVVCAKFVDTYTSC